MISRNTILILTLALAASAVAQTADPVVFPAMGTVAGTEVYIRSEASTTAYTCGKISRPATVTVIGRDGDWLQIVPPPGIFSVISKSYVERGAGDLGTVTGSPVRVRAGSLRDLGGIERHYTVQGHLNTGDTVEIVGQGSDFYKIVPPGGAYVWVSAQYVRLPGQEAPEPELRDDPVAASDLATAEPDDTPTSPALTQAGRQFLAVDDLLVAELQKPKGQQRLRGLLEQYQAIDAPVGSALRGAIDRRIAYVESAVELQEDAAEVEAMAARTRARRAELERRLGQPDPGQSASARPEVEYDAWGVLSASGAYPGGAIARRFILRNPDTDQMTAYARNAGDQVDLSRYAGQLVGVRGRVMYEPDTGLNIVDVTSVTVLAPVEPPPAAPAAPDMPLPGEPVEPPASALDMPPVSPPPVRPAGPPLPHPPEAVVIEPDAPPAGLAPAEPPVPEAGEPPAQPPAPTPSENDGPEILPAPPRPSRLIRPGPAEEDPSGIPVPPARPPRPSVDRPTPAPPEGDAPPTPTPPADADVPPPPARETPPAQPDEEDEPDPPAKPTVEIREPLPPPGLPIEDDSSDDGPAIDVREYE